MAFKKVMKVVLKVGKKAKAGRPAKAAGKVKKGPKSERSKKEGKHKEEKNVKKETGGGVKKKKGQSIIARGRLRRFMVFSGRRQKTTGGLTKESITKNKRGRYVSRKQQAHGLKMYQNVRGWNVAFRDARTQLNCQGFVAINGRTLLGQALYVRMKKLYIRTGSDMQKKEEVKVEDESAIAAAARAAAAAPSMASAVNTGSATEQLAAGSEPPPVPEGETYVE